MVGFLDGRFWGENLNFIFSYFGKNTRTKFGLINGDKRTDQMCDARYF